MPVSTWLPTDPAPASCQTELVVFALDHRLRERGLLAAAGEQERTY